MSIHTTAGTKFYIGDEKEISFTADLSSSDFTGESWTQIEPVESLGSFGDAAQEVEATFIGAARKVKLKGTRDAGSMELVIGLDHSDAGQLALLAAEKTSHNYAFRLVFDDAPAGGTPSERMFVAMVMSATEQLDDANNVVKLNTTLAVNSNVVRIDAAGP